LSLPVVAGAVEMVVVAAVPVVSAQEPV